MGKNLLSNIPYPVIEVCKTLSDAGFEAYIVGGALRDIILKRKATDFDISTDAKPEEIAGLFQSVLIHGDYGTVIVSVDGYKIDITPFRDDAPGRKPDYKYGDNIFQDLARRDFTINSMAYEPICSKLVDPFGGEKDLDAGIIRCTGSTKRIWEDPLRALRAVRFRAQLGFEIEASTLYAICSQKYKLISISKERMRDELLKLITGEYVFQGLVALVSTGIMDYIIPELMEGMGLMHHNKPVDVLEHNMLTCKYIKNTPQLRMAALLHDVAKPRTAIHEKSIIEFHNHHIESARMASEIMRKLRFDKTMTNTAVLLIENHMFHYGSISPISDARRLVSKVGWDNIYNLIELRKADRIASGFDDSMGPGLKKLVRDLDAIRIENSDYRIKDLTITGEDLIQTLNTPEGPFIGKILNCLLEKVIEEPELNKRDTLLKIASDLIN
jgi:tRNA nucleotidyltransferase (CCA-adding enzyme)